MNIILYQPEIPQNTGNIIRTCNVTKTCLILVKPLGFSMTEKKLRRAGLDYNKKTLIKEIEDLESFLEGIDSPFFFFSSKVKKSFHKVTYPEDSYLIFGNETSGLPDKFFKRWPSHFVTIPMRSNARCLNLSNSVAIALYEALRQQNFSTLQKVF